MVIHEGRLTLLGSFEMSTTPSTPRAFFQLISWDGSRWEREQAPAELAGTTAAISLHGDLFVGGTFESLEDLRVNHLARRSGNR